MYSWCRCQKHNIAYLCEEGCPFCYDEFFNPSKRKPRVWIK
jgi:transcription elongation factor